MNTFNMNLLCIHVFVILIISIFDVESIRNGRLAKRENFKYMVSIWYEDTHFCGGSILNKYYILSAGHCVYNRSTRKFKIVVGKLSRDPWFPITREIERVHLYYDYKPATRNTSEQIYWPQNDIALLKLKKPLKFSREIGSIHLPTTDVPYNIDCYVAGWGREHWQDGFLPQKLRYTILHALTPQECSELNMNHRENEFCAISAMRSSTVMEGDSGGPLVCGDTVVGIVSAGFREVESPVIFTDVRKFLDFIEEGNQ